MGRIERQSHTDFGICHICELRHPILCVACLQLSHGKFLGCPASKSLPFQVELFKTQPSPCIWPFALEGQLGIYIQLLRKLQHPSLVTPWQAKRVLPSKTSSVLPAGSPSAPVKDENNPLLADSTRFQPRNCFRFKGKRACASQQARQALKEETPIQGRQQVRETSISVSFEEMRLLPSSKMRSLASLEVSCAAGFRRGWADRPMLVEIPVQTPLQPA